jgi:glycogen(starch) synthase
MITPRQGVSIVLPCYNRGAYLHHWLSACSWWQPYDSPSEILVIDDGGTDDAEAVVDRWRAHGLDVRYLRLRDAGAPRNNARARNAGIRAARFPLVLNSDPDVVFVTDVVRALVDAWRPGAFCSVTGYYPLTRDASHDLWRLADERPLTPDDYRARLGGRHNLVHRPDGVYGLHGAFLCDRATLARIRGYDERFHLWGWEDRDLLLRLERGLGFERRFVDGATVVHQWHPPLRADQEPHDRATRSRVLWQMGWQQACATTLTSIERNPDGWGDEHVEIAAPVAGSASDAEATLWFDAYRHEAQVWHREGQPRIALARLWIALSRWWETDVREPVGTDDVDIEIDARVLDEQISRAYATGYAHARDLAIEYATIAEATGDSVAADAALTAAARLPGHRTAIVRLRAQRLAAAGRLDDAAALLEESLAAVEPGRARADVATDCAWPEAAARLVELHLQRGRPDRARLWVDLALESAAFELFERLLFETYHARLHAGDRDPRPWPPRIGDDCAGEFLFSAAMRARRAGLTFGSRALFEAYLASDPIDDDLRARAAGYRDEAERAWIALTTPRLSASIIVATRNRAAHLRRILPSLLQLEYEPLEIIVVVGPSEDDTLDIVEEYRDRMKIVMSPAANMCLSRNLGLAQAAGDVVIFIDDDAMPADRKWVDALVEPFTRDRRVAATGGPVLLRDGETWQFRKGVVSEYGEHVFVSDQDGPPTTGPGWFLRAMGTNMAFRREALLAIGGFDERIAYYGDECDVCVRLAAVGHAFAFVDAAVVRHYPAPSQYRHLIDRTRTIVHDDTYFCLRNARASWPMRFVRTVRKAAAKHYVTEVIAARRAGRLPAGDFARFLWSWARGFTVAVMESLVTRRRLLPTPEASAEATALLPLTRIQPARRLAIGLTSRRLACDGPCEGPARYTWDLARALHALGHDVHVFGESTIRTRHLALGLTVHGIAAEDIAEQPFPSHPTLNTNVAYALAVADRLRALRQSGVRLDVLHTTNWNFEGVGVLLDRDVPVVMMLVTSLAEVIEYGRWTRNKDLDAGVWLDRAQMQAASRLAAPTQGLVRKYVETGLIDAELASHVTPTLLGIALQPGARPAAVAAAEAHRAAGSARRLLFVGTHVRRKGLDDLLAVLPALLTACPDWTCDIVGDDKRIVEEGLTLKAQFLRDHAGQPWLSRVVFHGRIADDALWRMYGSASLYVVPSRFESFGLTYLEAMQFGVPVVATHAGGIPEVVRDNETGLLVPVGDREALHDAMARLMTDDNLRIRMGGAAREDVQQRWTHLHMAQRLLPLYEAAIDGSRTGLADERADRTAAAHLSARGQAIIDLIAQAGAPADLVADLTQSMTCESSPAGRDLLVNAVMGRLPAAALYVEAVERCLERGDAVRAARLVEDALAHAPDLTSPVRHELEEMGRVAARLAAGRGGIEAPPQTHGSPRSSSSSSSSSLDEVLTLVREGRRARALVRLWALADDTTLAPVERLVATYHLGSSLEKCGFADAAARTLSRVTTDRAFARLPTEVRAAAWFHSAEIARAAGRLDEADQNYSRCLELTPGHRRAAAARDALRQVPVAVGQQS